MSKVLRCVPRLLRLRVWSCPSRGNVCRSIVGKLSRVLLWVLCVLQCRVIRVLRSSGCGVQWLLSNVRCVVFNAMVSVPAPTPLSVVVVISRFKV